MVQATDGNAFDPLLWERGLFMRRTFAALLTAVALVLGVALSAGAQADLGNDGVDRDCGEFGGDQGAAQEYFVGDGGSASRNVDDLDRDNDGDACESGGGSGSQDTGTDEGTGSEDTGTDEGTGSEDDTGTEEGTGSEGGSDTGGTDDSGTSELPNTGAGPVTSDSSASDALMMALAGIAAFFTVVALRVRHQA